MAVLLWLLLLLVAFLGALASSTTLRKNVFIWFSYVTITGWYYFRVLQKKYSEKNVGMSKSSQSRTPSSATVVEKSRGQEVVYFESRNVVEQRQLEQLERSGSSRLSDSGSSGSSNDSTAISSKLKKRGLFRSRRKAAAEEAMRRVSDVSSADGLTNSGASESNAPVTTKRVYTGRKKPVSWTT